MKAARNSVNTMKITAIIATIKRTTENGRKKIVVTAIDGKEIAGIENEIIEVAEIMITIDGVSAIEIEIVTEIGNAKEIETEKENEIEIEEGESIKVVANIRKANESTWIVRMRTNRRTLVRTIIQAVVIMANRLMAPAHLRIINIKCRKFARNASEWQIVKC